MPEGCGFQLTKKSMQGTGALALVESRQAAPSCSATHFFSSSGPCNTNKPSCYVIKDMLWSELCDSQGLHASNKAQTNISRCTTKNSSPKAQALQIVHCLTIPARRPRMFVLPDIGATAFATPRSATSTLQTININTVTVSCCAHWYMMPNQQFQCATSSTPS